MQPGYHCPKFYSPLQVMDTSYKVMIEYLCCIKINFVLSIQLADKHLPLLNNNQVTKKKRISALFAPKIKKKRTFNFFSRKKRYECILK